MVEQQRPQTRKNSFYLLTPPTPVADRSLVDKLRSRVRRKSIFFPTVYVTISRCQRVSVQAQGTYLQSNNYCFRVFRAHNNVYIYARFSASLVLIHNNFLFFFIHKKLNGQVFVRYTFNRVQFLFFLSFRIIYARSYGVMTAAALVVVAEEAAAVVVCHGFAGSEVVRDRYYNNNNNVYHDNIIIYACTALRVI